MAETWGAGRQYATLKVGWSKDPDVADSYVIRTGIYTFTVENDYRGKWTFTTSMDRSAAGLIDRHESFDLDGVQTKAQALALGSRIMLSELADAADAGAELWLRQ